MAGRWTVNPFRTNDNAAIDTTQRTGGWTQVDGAGPAEGEDRRGRKDSLGEWPGSWYWDRQTKSPRGVIRCRYRAVGGAEGLGTLDESEH